MFSTMRDFLYRHQRKFLVTGIIVGGSLLAKTYAQRKLTEWQEKEAQQFFENIQRQSHHKSTELNCNQTIFSLASTLKETILQYLGTEEILCRIRSNEGNKIELWEELKIAVFVQMSTLLYAGLILVLVLRVQLNVMGGYLFKFKMNDKNETKPSVKCQENYLALCHFFINQGIKDLCSIIDKHVRLALKDVSLKQKMSLQDIEQLFWSVQSSLTDDHLNPLTNIPVYFFQPFPPQNLEGEDGQLFDKMYKETTEILYSDELIRTAESCIKRCYSNTVDRVTAYYVPTVNSNGVVTNKNKNGVKKGDAYYKNVTEITVPLAKVIPIIHGLAKSGNSSNEKVDPWIEQYIVMEPINLIGANIYEAFSYQP